MPILRFLNNRCLNCQNPPLPRCNSAAALSYDSPGLRRQSVKEQANANVHEGVAGSRLRAGAPPPQAYGPPPDESYGYAPPPVAYGYPPPAPYYQYPPLQPPYVVVPGPYYAGGPYWRGYPPHFAYGYGHWGHGYRRW